MKNCLRISSVYLQQQDIQVRYLQQHDIHVVSVVCNIDNRGSVRTTLI